MLKLITLLVTSSMTVMAGATISPALPQINQHFADVPNALFWVKLMLTIPGLFTAIGAPLVGTIIDRWGRKPLLLGSTLLYGCAGASGLILNSLAGLLVGRALLGLAVAGIMTTSTVLIADYYKGVRRSQVMGFQAGFMGFGGVSFLVLGGILADLGWRLPFAIYLTAFIAAGLVAVTIDEPRDEPGVDVPLMGAPVAAIAPLPPTLIWMYILGFGSMVAFYLVPVQLPFYLTELTQGGVTNAQIGLAIAALTLGSAIVSLFYQKIKAVLSYTQILIGVYGFMGLGYGLIAIAPGYNLVFAGTLLFGVGLGLLLPNLNVWLSAIVAPAQRGRTLGGLTTCLFLGQFASPILSQPLIQNLGLGHTYGVFGGAMIILAIGVWLLTLTHPSTPSSAV